MFVITGLGRSGTTFIAEVLRDCGFFMGEYYNPGVHAGYEHPDVVGINKKLLNGAFWGEQDTLDRMKRVSHELVIAKDPRFILTLGTWLQAGSRIDGVFLCTRDLASVLESSERSHAGTMAIFNGYPAEDRTRLAEQVLHSFLSLCRERSIDVHQIRYPESTRDFGEIACLSRVAGDEDGLRAAWQRVRRPPERSGGSVRSTEPVLGVSIHSFTGLDDYQARSAALLGATEQQRRDREEALAKQGDAFTVDGFCWTCGADRAFRVDTVSAKEDAGRRTINWRERLVCPGCGMNNRKRAALHLFHELLAPRPDAKIYVAEQRSPFFRRLAATYAGAVGSEYLGSDLPPGGANAQGIRNEDLMRLSFADGSFDHVIALDVFEHVPDARAVLRECRRVLKDGGSLFFTVPFDRSAQKNIVRAEIGPDGTVRHLLPPDYHGNPLDPKGSLAFHTFGWELLDLVREAGFPRARACLYWSDRYGYLGGNQVLFLAETADRPAVTAHPPRSAHAVDRNRNLAVCDQPVFVVGCPRSGTTILARSLGRHSRLWVSTESDFMHYMMKGIGAAYTFGTARKRIWLSTENVSREEFFAHVGIGFNALFTGRSVGKRWIDHSNSNTYCLEDLAVMFPRAKFLHIVRDGRDTVNSMVHFSPPQPWAADFATACRNWKLFVTNALAFERRHPDRVLRISYEDLVADPAPAFERILGFLDEPVEPDVAAHLSSTRINSSFSDADRQKKGWKVSWQPDQHAIFTSLCGPLLESLGYAADARGIASSSPAAPAELRRRAAALAARGDTAGAAGVLEECIGRFPRDASARNDLGVLSARLGRGDEARQCYQAALALAPGNTTYLKNFADFTFVVLGEPDNALPLYRQVVELAPDDREAHFALANIFLVRQEFAEARAHLERCLAVDPLFLEAQQALALVLDHAREGV